MDTSCSIDGTLFPFDSQSCSIVLESWAYSEAYVDLRNATNYVHIDGYNDDGQFNVIFQTECPLIRLRNGAGRIPHSAGLKHVRGVRPNRAANVWGGEGGTKF